MINFNKPGIAVAIFLACLLGQSASAADSQRSGTTVGGPIFTRPGASTDELFRYDAFGFSVSDAGDYSIQTQFSYDGYSLLYADAFDPVDATKNLVASNDDLDDYEFSGFVVGLDAHQNYYLVNTAFSSGVAGGFTTGFSGPGVILPLVAAVPEPETCALLLAGMGLMSVFVRRRQSRHGAV